MKEWPFIHVIVKYFDSSEHESFQKSLKMVNLKKKNLAQTITSRLCWSLDSDCSDVVDSFFL